MFLKQCNVFQTSMKLFPEAEFMIGQFRWGFCAQSWEFSDLRFPCTIIILQIGFEPLFFAQGGGGNPLVEVTVNNKEENSWDVCPNYVQEFGPWAMYEQSVRVLWAELLFISEYKQPCTNCVYKCTRIYQNTTSICTREQKNQNMCWRPSFWCCH